MRILLDENIPAKLKFDFDPDLDVKTVRDMKWQGTKNGALLKLIEDNKFDFFITLDTNLRFQQNLSAFSFTVILLVSVSNKHQILQPFVPKLKEIIDSSHDKKFFEVRI